MLPALTQLSLSILHSQVTADHKIVSSVCPAPNGMPCAINANGQAIVEAVVHGVVYFAVDMSSGALAYKAVDSTACSVLPS